MVKLTAELWSLVTASFKQFNHHIVEITEKNYLSVNYRAVGQLASFCDELPAEL
jgi:hypothetical protein